MPESRQAAAVVAARGYNQRTLQAPSTRRMAALNAWWKLADGHGAAVSEFTTADTRQPSNVNSTLLCGWLGVESSSQDFANASFSIPLLSTAMNRCIEITRIQPLKTEQSWRHRTAILAAGVINLSALAGLLLPCAEGKSLRRPE